MGESFWQNRFQDWRIENNKVICRSPEKFTTLHLLSAETDSKDYGVEVKLSTDKKFFKNGESRVGVVIGLSSSELDYRGRMLIQRNYGNQDGLWIGITGAKELFIENLSSGVMELFSLPDTIFEFKKFEKKGVDLKVKISQDEDQNIVEISVDTVHYQVQLAHRDVGFDGSIALAATARTLYTKFWMDDFIVYGDGLQIKNERKIGPIYSSLYSSDEGVIKLNAQLFAGSYLPGDFLILDAFENERWKLKSIVSIDPKYSTGLFNYLRIDNDSSDVEYRIALYRDSEIIGPYKRGVFRSNKIENDQVVFATVSCNGMDFISGSNYDFSDGWRPYEASTKMILKKNPDAIVFLGDQMYESRPFPADWRVRYKEFDYLYRWILWTQYYDSVISTRPTICLMDDHDYFQGNLWGKGGVQASSPIDSLLPNYYVGKESDWKMDNGGYIEDLKLIEKMVFLQTGHLPKLDRYETSSKVPDYFTTLRFKGVGLAIVEDRKFKSAPLSDLENIPSYSGIPLVDTLKSSDFDKDSLQLLGDVQLQMLDDWSENWYDEKMKIVLTQSVYSTINSVHEGYNPISDSSRSNKTHLSFDMDGNGWPKSGRDKALRSVRKSSAMLIGGDQHFTSLVHQGVENHKDAAVSFTVPPLNSTYPRYWLPGEKNHVSENNYVDGFGNKISMYNYVNPVQNDSVNNLFEKGSGVGFVVCDLNDFSYTVSYEGYAADSTMGRDDWSKRVSTSDNTFSNSRFRLGKIKTKKQNLLISVYNVDGEKLYSTKNYLDKLKVPSKGSYILKINDESTGKIYYKEVKTTKWKCIRLK